MNSELPTESDAPPRTTLVPGLLNGVPIGLGIVMGLIVSRVARETLGGVGSTLLGMLAATLTAVGILASASMFVRPTGSSSRKSE